ncbi:phenylacrylic acid decarboxylase [Campylobacter hyointestinalis subsp. hyointestinalis]|uniref:Phenylacrylic acid decarboxylase n=1 Tax=Campylobacter hyointestinalis subsp. hyointestinalis TaxID=91352 RepID=A0A0S4RWQ5_CAMHY|nr:UbiX family flavin prenyltransferase [Campylobacter hyointestinalis]PPB66748.1 3-octaprenyl-4-hydroxybenzoate carboxy-lyase [Campylobacter hyointestinalis subsp. hyointestinalis]PPB68465.1 3-octaprenyl-4-hydroxybenzoate carboxy-lyase [Campylobacter hyointestinalis subsp. hyointestinalis]PPB70793.1 3-octaprenyl-4-hydroxybenzoate carboxy-lyase [Campylobacter hyointestinalis subsp. hyointestinalis]TWO22381.1 UbiX family flavin prenyltransferase [Campylobacter hyointestinalis]CUU78185.1 phenyla
MKILVGITGASGTHLGLNLANMVSNLGHEVHLIISENAKISMKKEGFDTDDLNSNVITHQNGEIYSSAASGSSRFDKMIVVPCSINTLAKISCSLADNLIARAAAVMLKEHKTLILAVREMPFSAISLRQMSELSALGVIIAPPVLAYYSCPKNLDEMENFIIGKWLDLLCIEHDIFQRWN